MAKVRALGTKFTFNSVDIPNLTSIGEVSVSADELDATTLDSASGYREFLAGFKDSGEVTITGYHDGSAAQAGLRTAFGAGNTYATKITFPDNKEVTFNSFVKGYSIGSADVDGIVGFSATFRISGAVAVS
jgi:predicted secreted protein